MIPAGLRFSAGHGLWAVGAFLFPTLAIVSDDSVAVAMLLFLLETLLASAILFARLGVSGRSLDAGARHRLADARQVLQFFVTPFSLGCAILMGAVVAIEVSKGRLAADGLRSLGDRASWMASALLASAVLDSVLAPVRSVQWLETSVAWQGSRTAVMMLVVMMGWPVMLVTGTSQAFFWIFFALRLMSDVEGMRRSGRECIREKLFGEPYDAARQGDTRTPGPTGPKAPPPFSRAHGRHDVGDPGRLPP